ncbi:MAG: heavy-metal-associated domain-containing protein [Acidobacteria bacterium]|nr:heavy-metal-associated domain-containing protein [Acidobacteriota bacterium]MBI3663907.1 heavy-metal-associated domain-containing protein [Acidobacteriota bacterium]
MNRKPAVITAALLIAVSPAVGEQGKKADPAAPAAATLQLTQCALKVGGMTCSACEENVQKGLLKVDGVKSAKADAKTGEVVVKYDSKKTTPEKIVAAFNQSSTGYRAEVPKPKGQ